MIQIDTAMGIGMGIVMPHAEIWIDTGAGIAMMTEAAETTTEVITKHSQVKLLSFKNPFLAFVPSSVMIIIWNIFTGYDSRIGSGRRAFGSGYRRDDDYRGGGDRYEDRYDRRDDRSWSSRDDYSRDDYRRDDRGNHFFCLLIEQTTGETD